MFFSVGSQNFLDYQAAQQRAQFVGETIQVWHSGQVIRVLKVAGHDIPAALRDDYECLADFIADVRLNWMFENCLQYPCTIPLQQALVLMEREQDVEKLDGMYHQFLGVCKSAGMLERADRIWQESRSEEGSFAAWVDSHEDDWKGRMSAKRKW